MLDNFKDSELRHLQKLKVELEIIGGVLLGQVTGS